MRSEKKYTRGEEIGARARSIARHLRVKVYVGTDDIFLIRGKPDIKKFKAYLESTDSLAFTKYPSPLELGFSADKVEVITDSFLSDSSRALQKWGKYYNQYMQQKRTDASLNKKLRSWKKEIGELNTYLSDLYSLTRSQYQALGIDRFYFIGPEKNKYISLLNSLRENYILPERVYNYLHFLAWSIGFSKLENAIRNLRFLWEDRSSDTTNEQLSQFLSLLIEYKDTLDKVNRYAKKKQNYSEIKLQKLFQNSINHLQEVYYRFREESVSQISTNTWQVSSNWPSSISGFFEFSDQLIERISDQLGIDDVPSKLPLGQFLGLLAEELEPHKYPEWILVNVEGSDYIKHLSYLCNKSRFDQFLSCITNPIIKGGYLEAVEEEFLQTVTDVHMSTLNRMYESISKGLDDKHLLFLLEHFGQNAYKILRQLAWFKKPLNPLIEFIELLEIYDFEKCDRFIKALKPSKNLSVVSHFLKWLEHMPEELTQSEFKDRILSVVANLSALITSEPGIQSIFENWATPDDNINNENLSFPVQNEEVDKWFATLFYYQKMNNEVAKCPKSIDDLFHEPDKRRDELSYLQQRQELGELTPNQLNRLKLLEKQNFTIDTQKIIRQLKKVTAVTALNAIQFQLNDYFDQYYLHRFGVRVKGISPEEKFTIHRWYLDLYNDEERLFQDIVQNYSNYGVKYEWHMPQNRAWLESAHHKGVNVEKWYSISPDTIKIGDTSYKISIEKNPFQIFLMGERFNTCLSLDDSYGESVLINAADINKQVIYVYDQSDNIIARKLVALNSKHQMVGFTLYTNLEDTSLIEDIVHSVERFTDQWAEQCGVTKNNFGEVVNLHDCFWYDDGVCNWKFSDDSPVNPSSGQINVNNPDKIRSIFELYRTECNSFLQTELNIEIIVNFDTEIALLEEILALYARKKSDDALAEQVYNYCTTDSGKLEALTTLIELRWKDFLPDFIRHMEQFDNGENQVYKSRINYYLCRDGSADSFAELLDRLPRNNAGTWLIHFILSSRLANEKLIQILKENFQKIDILFDEFLIVLYLLRYYKKVNIDELLFQLFKGSWVWGGRNSFGFGGGVEISSNQLLWIPKFKEPEKYLNSILFSPFLNKQMKNFQVVDLLLATIALNNKSAISVRFLKAQAKDSRTALLALYNPIRFRETVKKLAIPQIYEPAALLSLFVVLEYQEVRDIFEQSNFNKIVEENYYEKVERYYTTFDDFTSESLQNAESLKQCEPYAIFKCWEYLKDIQKDKNPVVFDFEEVGRGIGFNYEPMQWVENFSNLINLWGLAIEYAFMIYSNQGNQADFSKALINVLAQLNYFARQYPVDLEILDKLIIVEYLIRDNVDEQKLSNFDRFLFERADWLALSNLVFKGNEVSSHLVNNVRFDITENRMTTQGPLINHKQFSNLLDVVCKNNNFPLNKIDKVFKLTAVQREIVKIKIDDNAG